MYIHTCIHLLSFVHIFMCIYFYISCFVFIYGPTGAQHRLLPRAWRCCGRGDWRCCENRSLDRRCKQKIYFYVHIHMCIYIYVYMYGHASAPPEGGLTHEHGQPLKREANHVYIKTYIHIHECSCIYIYICINIKKCMCAPLEQST